MATNAADPHLRRPPPLPSTGTAGAKEPAARPARRTSNRPPPRSFVSGPSGVASHQAAASKLPGKPTASSASSSPQREPSLPSLTQPAHRTRSISEERDELVRLIMPELRVLTEQLVKTAVERSVASLLDRQRELEVKVERARGASLDKPLDIDAKLEAALAPLLAKQRALEATLDSFRHAEVRSEARVAPASLATQSAVQVPISVDPLAMRRQTDALMAAALSRNAMVDIPAELNGSRRKRVVVFLLLITVIGILASVAVLSVMSNMGTYP